MTKQQMVVTDKTVDVAVAVVGHHRQTRISTYKTGLMFDTNGTSVVGIGNTESGTGTDHRVVTPDTGNTGNTGGHSNNSTDGTGRSDSTVITAGNLTGIIHRTLLNNGTEIDALSALRNIVTAAASSSATYELPDDLKSYHQSDIINGTTVSTTTSLWSTVAGTTIDTLLHHQDNVSLPGQSSSDTPGNAESWWDVWLSKPFPSGYTQLAIVLLAFFLTCVIILVVVGNLLVCIAIATEKSLKPVQNWFIASLAVSDLLIGLIIMPFSLARELMGYWMFGQVWCDIHAALDVLLCTASINSLFLISLDRYWSITQAVKYLKKRTPSRAAMMIAFVWIFSAFVSLPPLVGWKKGEQSSEYPQCNLSDDIGYVLYSSIGSFYFPALMMVFVYAKIFIAARSRARRHLAKKRFKIPGGNAATVPIPGATAATATANEIKEKSTTTTLCTSFSNPSPPTENIVPAINNGNNEQTQQQPPAPPPPRLDLPPEGSDETAATKCSGNNPPVQPPQIIIETSSSDSRRQSWNIISTSELISSIKNDAGGGGGGGGGGSSEPVLNPVMQSQQPTLQPPPPPPPQEPYPLPKKTTYFAKVKRKSFEFARPKINGLTKSSNNNSISKSNGTIDEDSDTADSPTIKDSGAESKGFLSAPKLLRSRFGSSLSIADYEDSDNLDDDNNNNHGNGSGTGGGSGSGTGSGKRTGRNRNRVQYQDQPIHLPTTDAERHKRKIAKARERRATLIVGLIMAAFITAWLPFFVLYVLVAFCQTCKENIPEGVFAVAFWLGYGNSAANPIIYTIFNRDYRKAFRKILFHK